MSRARQPMSIELRVSEFCRRYPIDSFGVLKGGLVEIRSVGYTFVAGKHGSAHAIVVFVRDAPDKRILRENAPHQPALATRFRDSRGHDTAVRYRRLRGMPKALD